MKKLFKIGVDIGTTSTKAVLYYKDFSIRDTVSKSYPTVQEEEGMAEQNPEAIFEAVLFVLKSLHEQNPTIREQIEFVSFSSAMHSLMAVSHENKPLTPIYTWADNRSNEVLEVHQQKTNLNWIYLQTGTPIHSMSPFSKLLWLKTEYPDLFKKSARFVGIKEYITYRLTGEWKIDYSLASATGLFNLEQLDWDSEVLNYIGIGEERLSDLVDTDYFFTEVIEETFAKASLSLETKILIGASDGCLANLGLNAVNSNEVAMTIGTSGAVRMVTNNIVLDPHGRTFCYYLSKNRWVIGGAVNNGGNALEWIGDLFKKDYDELDRLAEMTDPGTDGLFFFPYLNGERAPLWDASARGHFIGISSIHSTRHFVRAVMEGVLFNIAEVLTILETIAGPTRVLKVNGGFLRSPLWKQMVADVLNKTLTISSQFESSCLGAVLIREPEDSVLIEQLNKQETKVCPDQLTTESYKEKQLLYQLLSDPLKEIHAITKSYTTLN